MREAARAVGLEKPIFDVGLAAVYRLKEPKTVIEMAEEVREILKIQGSMRITGDPERLIETVAHLSGGAALISNIFWTRLVIENGAQAAICGETQEFFMEFARDANFPIIETSHRCSEEPGIIFYAEELKKIF